MTLRHRIPWIPMGFPQDSKDFQDSHEIPGIPTGFPGFPQDSRDSHRISKIPGIPMGFGIQGIRRFPLATRIFGIGSLGSVVMISK
jgi:hypothetical protein